MAGVHALTDVTGFGLLGHLLDVCKGSSLHATIRWDAVPMLPEGLELAREGYVTGASKRNWAGYGQLVNLTGYGEIERALLTDPQTRGGLLVACAPEDAEAVLATFRAGGFERAAVQRSLDSRQWSTISVCTRSASSGSYSCSDTGLISARTYYYRAWAISSGTTCGFTSVTPPSSVRAP